MAYSTSAPPVKVLGDLEGTWALWVYRSTDGTATVDASGYITNGYDLGMRHGHTVLVIDTDASPIAQTLHAVNVSGTTVDLSNGVDVGSTNSD
jgi:hypothetical protein